MGLIISFLSFLFIINIFIKKIFFGIPVPGYPALMTAILFMGGVQLISLGINGEYVSRIYKETKRRPIYIIDKKIGFD